MATLLDLFKSQKKELYGKSGMAIIESRGFINPPRGAALLTSSPNAIADLVGNQIGGLLGGSANRPTDTIFKNDTVFSKPLSLFKTQQQLRDAVEADTPYFIKTNPSPSALFAPQGASSIGGTLFNTANNLLAKGGLKDLKKQLKKADKDENYGVKLGKDGKKLIKENKKFSEYYKDKTGVLTKRTPTEGGSWNNEWHKLRLKTTITDTELKDAEKNGHVVVTFGKIIDDIGNVEFNVPFIGSITGLSEDVTPTWNPFKYLGSPFNIYRYGGVERSIKFNLKLYYLTNSEKEVMIKKINYLKSLAFPDTNIVTSKFGETSQYAIAPNIIKFGIGSLYKNVPGYLESLSFTIDDSTTWPKMGKDSNYLLGNMSRKGNKAFLSNYESDNKDDNFMYPSVIDVSLGLKIIENHKIEGSTTKTFKYDFDGLNDDGKKYTIKK